MASTAVNFSGPIPVPVDTTVPLSVLITGASRGIGFELVRQYSEVNKANRVFAGVRDVKSAGIVALAAANPNITIVALDTDSDDSIRASVDEVKKVTDSLDVLVANAGIWGEAGTALNATRANLSRVFDTNVNGSLVVTQAYLPLLRASRRREQPGRVIFISSSLGSNVHAPFFLNRFGEHAALGYNISKAALNYLNSAFTVAAPELIFISVSPGWIRTDMGSQNATVDVKDGVQALRALIETRKAEHSGQFIDNIQHAEVIPY